MQTSPFTLSACAALQVIIECTQFEKKKCSNDLSQIPQPDERWFGGFRKLAKEWNECAIGSISDFFSSSGRGRTVERFGFTRKLLYRNFSSSKKIFPKNLVKIEIWETDHSKSLGFLGFELVLLIFPTAISKALLSSSKLKGQLRNI